jgi:protein involved in polysaccharide export with SLBB domain
VFVASTSFNAAYVIGEVQHAGKVSWEGNLSLMDAVGEAGGSTTKAKLDHVLVVSGGLADPTLKLVDAGGYSSIAASSKTRSRLDVATLSMSQ